MKNPNDPTAKYYDLVNRPLKGDEVVEEEIKLITSIIKSGSKILDLGAGTGRHTIPLSLRGYEITALDNSLGMLKILKDKIEMQKQFMKKLPEVMHSDIFRYKPSQKFDLVILMWNTFNEIALTKQSSQKLLKKIKQSLISHGKIIINIDNSEAIDPARFSFVTHYHNLKQEWKTIKFFKKTNTSYCEEKIILDLNGKKKVIKTMIKQRWWRLTEIREMAKQLNLKLSIKSLNVNGEYYLILE